VWFVAADGMCSVTTGATLAAISAAAASACRASSLVVIDASVVDRLCDQQATCLAGLDAMASGSGVARGCRRS